MALTTRLHIDRTRCAGHGICALLAPTVVDLDPWGFPELQAETVGTADRARVGRAVAACPRRALTLEAAPPARPLDPPPDRPFSPPLDP